MNILQRLTRSAKSTAILSGDALKKKSQALIVAAILFFLFPALLFAQPTVTSTTPTRNALNVEKDGNIIVTFSQDIDATTLTNSTVRINGSLSGLHPATFSYNSETYTATINPSNDFKVGDVVKVMLTRGIKSTIGNSLLSAYGWSFTVKTNMSEGIFETPSTISAGGSNPYSIAVGDWNGNGTLDLAIVNCGSSTVTTWMNNGIGGFAYNATINVGSSPAFITAGDWNADGSLDLAVANYNSGTVSIMNGNGSGSFAISSTLSLGYKSRWIGSGDFNGDGMLDLAIANENGNAIAIWFNAGNGTFSYSSAVGVGITPYTVIVGDWNGDGWLDLATANYASGTVSILLNNGSGGFSNTSTVGVGSHPSSMTTGDWNRDGSLDLAVSNNGSNTVSVLFNNGGGGFTVTSTVGVGSAPTAITAGDWNGDGFLDLAVANYNINTVSVLKNNGSGGFTQVSMISVQAAPIWVTAGDWNSDGTLDLAVANYGNNCVSIVKNHSFPASPNGLVVKAEDGQVTLKWNKNSETDFLRYRIYCGTSPNPTIRVDSTTASISDTTKIISNLENGTMYYFRITAVDNAYNESGFSNEVSATPIVLPTVTAFTPSRNALSVEKNVNLTVTFSQDIDPTTLTNSTVCINGSVSGLHASTFNYDSGTRTVTITPTVSFKIGDVVSVMLTRGITNMSGGALIKAYSWNFTVKANRASVTLKQSFISGVGNNPRASVAGDFDNDGDIDLAVANAGSNTVSILLNSGSGTFTQSSTPGVGSNPYSVTTGDFDRDGDLDLAIANAGSNTVSILLNNGTGTFTQSSTPGVGSYPQSVTAGDFDGDGDLDLAVANYNSLTVSILLNNGSGTFTQSSTPSVSGYPQSVTAGDFDGDGDIDLAVANAGSNTVSILLNNGAGIFTQSSTVGVGSNPYSVTAGDFDGDGDLDLAIANFGSATVSILLNNGSGTFTQSSMPVVGGNPFSVTTGDFDGDGDLDLATANFGSATVSISLNNGSGTFTLSSTMGMISPPQSVTAGDFDGDGDLDLGEVNYGSNTVAILKNIPLAPQTLVVADSSSHTVTLKWRSNIESSLLRYRVYMDTASSPITKVDSTTGGIADTSKTITGLINGIKYYFRITAVDNTGNESSFSNGVSSTPIGLIAYYPFNSNVNDESGNGNNGTNYGATPTIDRFRATGKAYDFNGVSDSIVLPHFSFDNKSFTISVWVNKNIFWTENNDDPILVQDGHAETYDDHYLHLMLRNNKSYFGFYNNDLRSYNTAINNNHWYHIVYMYDQVQGKKQIFVDGVLDCEASSSSFQGTTGNTIIGVIYSSKFFDGKIDDISIYNLVLSTTEIQALYSENGWPAPAIPQNLTAVTGDAEITLKWNRNTESDFLRYRIYMDTVTSPLVKVDSTTGEIADTLKSITGLTNGTWYYFRITAVDSTGNESGYSNEVNAMPVVILPVELATFTTSIEHSNVELKWKTETEINNYGFEVERRAVSSQQSTVNSWMKIDFVAGAGTSNSPKDYSFIDANLASGRYAYRLKQVDNDGTFKYSQDVEIEILVPKVFALSQNYPNPFNPATTIEFTLAEDGMVSLRVFDILGREVQTLVNGEMKAGEAHSIIFDASKLSSGLYFYRLETGKSSLVKKLMLLK
jgi:fibronectin type 3 domain-containing protein